MKQKNKVGRPEGGILKGTFTVRVELKKKARIVKKYGSLSKAIESINA